jgi:integrase
MYIAMESKMNKHTSRIGAAELTAIMKGKLTWSTKQPPLIHDGGGLYLQPRDHGGGTWSFRYTKDGRTTFAGLGRLEDVSATEARRKRDVLKASLREGGDPVRDRQREGAVERAKGADLSTYAAVVEGWLQSPRFMTKPAGHRHQLIRIAHNHIIPALGDLAVDDITGDHIIRLVGLHPLSSTVQQRVMYVLVKSINFANAARPVAERCANVAADPLVKEAIGTGRQGTPHDKMAVKDVPAFMARLWVAKSVSSLGMMAIILTGLRCNEALGARWSEIAGDVWTIPGDDAKKGIVGRMKAKEGKARQQRVPVSPGLKMVLDTLRPLRRSDDDYIFPSPRKGQHVRNRAMADLLKDYRVEGVTTHGFRSTLMDFFDDKGVPHEVTEAMLHHILPGVSGKHYNYDRDWLAARIEPMKAWADYCMSAIPAEQRHLRVVA